MGEDNRIKSIEIKDGALQFKVRPILAGMISRLEEELFLTAIPFSVRPTCR